MNVSKDIIRDVLNAYTRILNEIRQTGMCPSDFTFEDLVEMVYEELP